MKSLSQYIYESLNIGEQQINESFKCSILQKLDMQYKENYSHSKKEFGYSMFGTYNFSKNIASRIIGVNWDKIENSAVTTYEGGTLKDGVKEFRKILRANYSGNNKIMILEGSEGKMYAYGETFWNSFAFIPYSYYRPYNDSWEVSVKSYGSTHKMKQYEIMNYVEQASKIYSIDLTDYIIQSGDKNDKNKRFQDKNGIVYSTVEYYKNIAEGNRKRYREELASRRSYKKANKKLLDDIKELTDRSLFISNDILEYPNEYADVLYRYQIAMEGLTAVMKYSAEYTKAVASNVNKKNYGEPIDIDKIEQKLIKQIEITNTAFDNVMPK